MAKDFNDLLNTLPVERRRRIDQNVEEIRNSPVYQLRKAMQLTQAQVAEELGIGQAAVSKLERRPDKYLSTLRRFVEAMGGELEIHAKFESGDVVIDLLPAETDLAEVEEDLEVANR
jgi:transcriptional regulator with XRE-family HTH domain